MENKLLHISSRGVLFVPGNKIDNYPNVFRAISALLNCSGIKLDKPPSFIMVHIAVNLISDETKRNVGSFTSETVEQSLFPYIDAVVIINVTDGNIDIYNACLLSTEPASLISTIKYDILDKLGDGKLCRVHINIGNSGWQSYVKFYSSLGFGYPAIDLDSMTTHSISMLYRGKNKSDPEEKFLKSAEELVAKYLMNVVKIPFKLEKDLVEKFMLMVGKLDYYSGAFYISGNGTLETTISSSKSPLLISDTKSPIIWTTHSTQKFNSNNFDRMTNAEIASSITNYRNGILMRFLFTQSTISILSLTAKCMKFIALLNDECVVTFYSGLMAYLNTLLGANNEPLNPRDLGNFIGKIKLSDVLQALKEPLHDSLLKCAGGTISDFNFGMFFYIQEDIVPKSIDGYVFYAGNKGDYNFEVPSAQKDNIITSSFLIPAIPVTPKTPSISPSISSKGGKRANEPYPDVNIKNKQSFIKDMVTIETVYKHVNSGILSEERRCIADITSYRYFLKLLKEKTERFARTKNAAENLRIPRFLNIFNYDSEEEYISRMEDIDRIAKSRGFIGMNDFSISLGFPDVFDLLGTTKAIEKRIEDLGISWETAMNKTGSKDEFDLISKVKKNGLGIIKR